MTNTNYLDVAQAYANINSGCNKVAVGCAIVKDGRVVSLGANRAIPNLCKVRGCLRVEKYGEDSKNHRNPEDCRAIHSEIDAIANARESLVGASIFVTRYPCEACARAIISAGISEVVYGGTTRISDQTLEMFESSKVRYTYVPDWKEDLSDR